MLNEMIPDRIEKCLLEIGRYIFNKQPKPLLKEFSGAELDEASKLLINRQKKFVKNTN